MFPKSKARPDLQRRPVGYYPTSPVETYEYDFTFPDEDVTIYVDDPDELGLGGHLVGKNLVRV